MDLWVGSYTAASGGNGVGISTFRRAADGSLSLDRELPMTSPSWLTAHPTAPVVYATNESKDGTITTVSADLEILGTISSGGADPCHLTVSADGRHLLCSNYSSGSLSVFALAEDGAVTGQTDLVQHEGSGPHPERQEAAHVHTSVVRDRIVNVIDLGTDEISAYTLTGDGRLDPVAVSAMPPGTGPRMLLRRDGSDLAYVVGEVGGTLVVVREGPVGTFTPLTTVPATKNSYPGQPNWVAHVEQVGDRLYVSNRNPDCVTEFDVTGEVPVPLDDHPCGAFPRHFAVVGDTILVAAQKDDAIVALPIVGGGEPVRYPTGTPTCVLVR